MDINKKLELLFLRLLANLLPICEHTSFPLDCRRVQIIGVLTLSSYTHTYPHFLDSTPQWPQVPQRHIQKLSRMAALTGCCQLYIHLNSLTRQILGAVYHVLFFSHYPVWCSVKATVLYSQQQADKARVSVTFWLYFTKLNLKKVSVILTLF